MGDKSAIQWTDATWNPWMGCHKVSAGCARCYMFREQIFYGNDPNVVRRSKTTFEAPLKWHDPRKVFTCSWSDFFIEEADSWRDEAWDIIRKTPQHTYQILTKRPENIMDRLPRNWGGGYPNVWLGVSAENQAEADARIPILLQTPADTRFVSAEPLLGPIILKGWDGIFQRNYIDPDYTGERYKRGPLDWVIIGGESGPGCRPMDIDWVRWIVTQCREANVPVFVKQLGGHPNKRGKPEEWPEDLRVREFPNGRLE